MPHYLEKSPLPATPAGRRRQFVMGAFVSRLRVAIGLKQGPMQTSGHHSYDCDKPSGEKKARLPSPRIRTYSFDTATGGRSITTKQMVDHQPDQVMARFGANGTITDEEAHQLSSFNIGYPNRVQSIHRENINDLEGMVTEFVRAEDTKRSRTGSGAGSARQGSGSKYSPSTALV